MPGIHAAGVGAEPAGLAALGGDDVQLAVRLEQHVAAGLAEHDPSPIRRVPREEVAHAVVRCALDRLGRPSLAIIEREPVEVEQERLAVLDEFLALLASQQDFALALGILEVVRPGPGENDVLAVGAPGGIALDELRVVGAGQGAEVARLPVVEAQDALEWEEQL